MSEKLTRLALLNENPIDPKDDKNKNEDKDKYNFFPHDKVIESLKDTITNNDTNKQISNKVILLSGRWGTGKTSVLNHLKDKLIDKRSVLTQ